MIDLNMLLTAMLLHDNSGDMIDIDVKHCYVVTHLSSLPVMFSQNDPCTNAGMGSTLSFNGTVECDACVMDGEEALFGAVGALSGG